MADKGKKRGVAAVEEGGSEAYVRAKTFEYKAMSNLVIQGERPRGAQEPTGEVESLRGRSLHKMGDRAVVSTRGRDKEMEERLEKMKKRKAEKATKGAKGKKVDRTREPSSILQATEEMESLSYIPKTRDTRLAYEQILNFVQTKLGDVSSDLLKSVANEILTVLKDDKKKDNERKKDIEGMLAASITGEDLARLVSHGKAIVDWTEAADGAAGDNTLDEKHGVAVVFGEGEEGEESGDESDDYEVKDPDGEDAEGATAEGAGAVGAVQVKKESAEEAAENMEVDDELPISQIDAHWLQREIGKHIADPIESQKLAEQVFRILKDSSDRRVENDLVAALEITRFDLIKLLLRNRWKIVYSTLLKRAQDDKEREAIFSEMRSRPELGSVLAALEGKKAGAGVGDTREAKAKSIEKTIRQQARQLGAKALREEDKSGPDVSKGRTLLDLDSLKFAGGAHLMSNKSVKLPQGSFRTTKKGYEEVHIPALKHAPMGENERLVPISEMPEWAHDAFKNMKQLNRVQSKLYQSAMFGAENLLVCAPTGAGKTNVAMLTIMHEIGLNRSAEGEIDKSAFKIIYIAPMKSLVQEMVGNFTARLSPYGLTVKELTGDQNLTKQQINETQIIVTTPEKWDIITRKSGDRTFTSLVRLVIIDEVHLLHDDRGPVLESIIARTIRQIESTQENVRLVGLSATLPNFEDVATLLRVPPTGLFTFDNSFRPCPLEQTYIGITEKKGLKRLQLMNEICYEKVLDQAGKNQVLVFVHSRKDTAKTAKALRDMALANDTLGRFLKEDSASRAILQAEEKQVKNADLKELLPYGFAIHHAGMVRADRTAVEDLFSDGHIQVLVSTATLAWGVNLPAHTVIIKGTQVYSPEKGGWTELSPLDVMQMLGRGGRPAFDTFGEGIVITSHHELQYYLSLLNHQLPIESQLISRLADQMNAEIVLGSIANLSEAVVWLGYTYLYICMLRSPQLYGIPAELAETDPALEVRRLDLVHTAATILDKANLIKYDRKTGAFHVTDLGRVASHYYVSHTTMAVFNDHLRASMSDVELLRLFSLSGEFKYISVRDEERAELERLLERVPVPVKESMEEPSAKINVLLQAYISRLKMEGFALMADMVYITQSAGRIFRALFEIVLRRGWGALAVRILSYCKMVDRRMWASQSPLRQFKNLPEDILKKLESKNFAFERLYDLGATDIGELIHQPEKGKLVHKLLRQFPKLELAAHMQPITRSTLRVELTITPDFQFDEKVHQLAEPFWLMVTDVDGDNLLYSEYFLLKKKFAEEEHTLTFTVPLFEPLQPHYFIRLVSDKWIGAQTVLPVSFRNLILPEKELPPTDLFDLQPVPLAAVKNQQFESLYDNIKFLNPIQTQAFPAVFNTDENVLVCAPSSSGKTLLAELAILRLIHKKRDQQVQHMRVVYVAPKAELVADRARDWSQKFGGAFGVQVVELTGELAADLKLLERGEIVLATPEKWDMVSRRWAQRKSVQNVQLFIVDELHLLGFAEGYVLEVVVARMRYMSQQLEAKVRVICLSSSLSNAKDVGDWIGATSKTMFNFHPNTRPVPLEIHIQGFDIAHPGTRFMAMLKPALSAVVHHGGNKPIMMAVPSKKEAALLAHDLRVLSESDDVGGKTGASAFLKATREDLAPFESQLRNKMARELIPYGIGLMHEAIPEQDRLTLMKLYNAGAIQILIVTHPLVWSLSMQTHLLVIVGTQYYDGKEHGYVDYPIVDIMQLMGRASRPNVDESGVCVVLCHSPKKEYYKKFLYEPLPIESHLEHFLADPMNAEIVTKTIGSMQEAMEYLTWTFCYRRFTRNPNYYNLQGISHRHLNDHLSELVETTIRTLQDAKMVQLDEADNMKVTALDLGMIAAYYNIKYTTIQVFSLSLTAKSKMKGLLEVLSQAAEFDSLTVRRKEAGLLRKLAAHLPLKIDTTKFADPHTKAHILLQAHFSRKQLTSDLADDQKYVVETAVRLLQAIVDVISSNGWLTPALQAMELSQMVIQGVWDSDPILKQLPHVSEDTLKRLADAKVETIFDLMELDDAKRRELLSMNNRQLADVARVSNMYPNVEVAYAVQNESEIVAASSVLLEVDLKRELDEEVPAVTVHAPLYPKMKIEGWWLVLGDVAANHLLAVRRVTFGNAAKAKLDFTAPAEPGTYKYTLYFMCDSYTGCDQEYEVKIHVK